MAKLLHTSYCVMMSRYEGMGELVGMEGQDGMRLNKYLSDAGVCSRREADTLIESGKVLVDGALAVLGMRILKSQTVTVNGTVVVPEEEEIFLAVNKPIGIVCTTTSRFQHREQNIVDYIGYPKRVYPIGRLDKDSEGLILMTNKGELVNDILRGSNGHEKEYLVTVNRPLTEEFLQRMAEGVPILDMVTKPCKLERTGDSSFRIILTQGLNRQIRRMCEYCGYHVLKLKRVRVMNIRLNDLKSGTYRRLSVEELAELKELLKGAPLSEKKAYGENDGKGRMNGKGGGRNQGKSRGAQKGN